MSYKETETGESMDENQMSLGLPVAVMTYMIWPWYIARKIVLVMLQFLFMEYLFLHFVIKYLVNNSLHPRMVISTPPFSSIIKLFDNQLFLIR